MYCFLNIAAALVLAIVSFFIFVSGDRVFTGSGFVLASMFALLHAFNFDPKKHGFYNLLSWFTIIITISVLIVFTGLYVGFIQAR